MKPLQKVAASMLVGIFVLMVLAAFLLPAHYARQFRDIPNVGPSKEHPLGTDALGRDSCLDCFTARAFPCSSPQPPLFSPRLISAFLGSVAGLLGGWFERMVSLQPISLSLYPGCFCFLSSGRFCLWMFRRSCPWSLLFNDGAAGWQASVRVICASARGVRDSDFCCWRAPPAANSTRLLWRHVAPNLRPLFYAQFFISIPLFILTEANLSILGLGVMEPMPSWEI